MKKVLVVVGGVLALGLVLLGIAFATLDPQRLVNEKKDALLQDVSKKLGRSLTTGPVTAQVGTTLSATIPDVKLAGARADAPAQFEIRQVHARFSLWRALVSFGKDLHVEQFTVDGMTLRAARDAEGRWDFQDMLDASAGEGDKQASADDKGGVGVQGLRIAALNLRDARIELDDAMLGRKLAVAALNVGSTDIAPGTPLSAWLTANLEDGARKTPVDVRIKLAQLPPDLSFDPVPDVDISARITDLDLQPWGALLPADSAAPVAGMLRVDAQTHLADNANAVDAKGTLNLRGVVLREAVSAVASAAERASAPRGSALDVDLAFGVQRDARKQRLVVDKLSVQGSGAHVLASVTLQGEGLAGLQEASVDAKIDDVNRLLSALPPSLRGLPEQLHIDGPLQASLSTKGKEIEGVLLLDAARVRYVGRDEATGADDVSFDKAAGRALNVKLHGTRNDKALDVDAFALALDSAKIAGTLSLPTDSKAPFSANIGSGPVQLSSLQSLLPPFAAAIGKGQRVDGTVEIKLAAQAAGEHQQADAQIALQNLDVNLASTIARGAASLQLQAVPSGDNVGLVVHANFDGLAMKKLGDDGTAKMDKPAGLPLRLDVNASKSGDDATVKSASLVVGRSTLQGKGTVKDIGGDHERMDVDFGLVDVAFDDLRQALPGASSLPRGGHAKAAVKLEGALSAAGMRVTANKLDMTFGKSVVQGDLRIDNLDTPTLDVNLPTLRLAFDDVKPLSSSLSDLPSGGRYEGSLVMKGNTAKSETVVVDAKIDALQIGKSDLAGTIHIANLDAPRFQLDTRSAFLDVDALRAAFGSDSSSSSASGPASDDNPHGLSKSTRATLASVSGKASMKAKRALVKGMEMSDFTGTLTMTRGVLKFDTLDFGFYGGTVSATGTLLELPAERMRYDINFAGKNIDFGRALSSQTPLGRLFRGSISPKLTVKGKGIAVGDFAISADGPAELQFASLGIASLDVLKPIDDAMKKAKAPGFSAMSASNDAGGGKGGLDLQGFTALTRFIGGKLRLEKPVEANTALGKMSFEGASGLDGGVELKSTLQLSPATIAKMTGGKIRVKDAVPIPMRIGGTWDKPIITGVDVAALLKAVVGNVVGGAVNDAIDKGKDKAKDAARDAAKDALNNLLGGDKNKKKKK